MQVATTGDPTTLDLAYQDVIAKTQAVAAAKQNIGTVRDEATRERKAKITAAHAKLDHAKAALEEARKLFDHEIRAATKP